MSTKIQIIAAFVSLVFFGPAVVVAGHAPTIQLEAVASRLSSLRSVVVVSKRWDTYTPAPELLAQNNSRGPGGTTIKILAGTFEHEDKFAFLDGLVRYETRLSGVTLSQNANAYKLPLWEIETYSPDRFEHLFWRGGKEPPVGGIRDGSPFRDFLIDYALGFREIRGTKWISPTDIESMDIEGSRADELVVSRIDGRGYKHRWSFDPALGYAPRRYETISPEGVSFFVVTCRDFSRVNGFMLPLSVEARRFYVERGVARPRDVQSLRVQEYRVNDKDNTPKQYRIAWPKGTHVVDQRAGETIVVTRDGVLDDKTIQELVDQKQQRRVDLINRTQKRIDELNATTRPVAPPSAAPKSGGVAK